MTRQYLAGELSVRLEQLQQVVATSAAADVACLRDEVERGPLAGLAPAAARAIELADNFCWDSLSRGDVSAFARQAAASADLRLFGVCSGLLAEH